MKEDSHKKAAVILLYHQVGSNPIDQTNLDCYCDQHRFEEQMSFLNDSEYKVIGLEELARIISSRKTVFDEDYVVLTFDDGCSKFSRTVLPILKKYHFASTLYPVAGSLGQLASWPKVVNPDLSIVSEFALRELVEQGVNIGAHTINHVKLSTCDANRAMEEIAHSKELLESVLHTEITSFSYPHGDYNGKISSLVKSLGFSNAVTCDAKYVKSDTDLFELPRKYITYFDTIESFKKKLTND